VETQVTKVCRGPKVIKVSSGKTGRLWMPSMLQSGSIKQEICKKKKAITPVYKDDDIISRGMSTMEAKKEKGKAKREHFTKQRSLEKRQKDRLEDFRQTTSEGECDSYARAQVRHELEAKVVGCNNAVSNMRALKLEVADGEYFFFSLSV
jgi:hypothetical protein